VPQNLFWNQPQHDVVKALASLSENDHSFKHDAVHLVLALHEPEEQRQPSCFALEEETGESWSGTGASRPLLIET
jgi:hypothetical protein